MLFGPDNFLTHVKHTVMGGGRTSPHGESVLDSGFLVDDWKLLDSLPLAAGATFGLDEGGFPAVTVEDTFVSLAALGNFVVLASSTIESTGATVLTGDLGLSPGSSVVGFPPGTVSGTQHVANGTAAAAQVALTAAYLQAQALEPTQDLTGIDLGGLVLGPGVYSFSSSAQLTGTLTLDGGGDPNASWVFQIGSTLTTASASVVDLINSASAGNVIWQVGSSATLGSTTDFQGNILAQASITLVTAATFVGRLLARTGAITLDANVGTVTGASQSGGGGGSAVATVGWMVPRDYDEATDIIVLRIAAKMTGSTDTPTLSASGSRRPVGGAAVAMVADSGSPSDDLSATARIIEIFFKGQGLTRDQQVQFTLTSEAHPVDEIELLAVGVAYHSTLVSYNQYDAAQVALR